MIHSENIYDQEWCEDADIFVCQEWLYTACQYKNVFFVVQKLLKISARYIIYFFSLGMTNVPSFKVQTIKSGCLSPINWCRVSSIHSMSMWFLLLVGRSMPAPWWDLRRFGRFFWNSKMAVKRHHLHSAHGPRHQLIETGPTHSWIYRWQLSISNYIIVVCS